MFSNVRNAFNNAARDVSQHFDHNRRRQQRTRTSAPSAPSAPSTQTHPNWQQPQEPPPSSQRAPPASTKAIKQLPTILVAPEDLVDPNNRECCVCLDDNKLDEKVTRLPCAHIFHTCCIIDWLANHSCTCPVCRYELPTDDPRYESGRIERMKTRKPRFAMHELKRMPIPALLALNRRPVSGVLEKKDLIQVLIDQDWIDIIPSPEPVEYKLEVLRSMKIGLLKRTMAEAGVFFRREDVLMKSDMISLFENSGRLVLIQSEPDESTIAVDNYQTTTNVTSHNDERSSPIELSYNHSDVEKGSDTKRKEHQIVVETVKEDSFNPDGNSTTNKKRDEKTFGPPIVMFPDRDAELIEENREHPTRNDAIGITPTVSNTQNSSSPQIPAAMHNVADSTSVTSDMQNLAHSEILHQQESTTRNTAPGEDRSDSDETQNISAIGSDMQSDTQGLEPMDIEDESISAAFDLLHRGTDLRTSFQHYTINHLQTLGRDLQIDLSYCLEREEMIHMLVNAGITGSRDPLALSPLMFSSWSISQLRVVASAIKIDLSQCKTGDEMVEKILYAGNVERLYLRDYLRSLSPLTTKPLPDLRAIARELQVNISDCLEKDEIIQRLITQGRKLEDD